MVSEQEGLERYRKILNEQLDGQKILNSYRICLNLRSFWRYFGHSGWTLFWRLRRRRKRITGQW